MPRIDLPGGQWAELRRPEDVSERLRRPITRAMRGVRPEIQEQQLAAANLPDDEDGKPGPEKQQALRELQFAMTNEEADAYQDVTDLATVALVREWSFAADGQPLPITLDGVLDLPARTLDALRVAVAPHVSGLFVDADPDPNPSAPGRGSDGSTSGSAAAPSTTLPSTGAPSPS
jgi:hypothetical protein